MNLIDYNTYIMEKKEERQYFFVAGISLFLLGYLFYKNLFLSALLTLTAIPLKKKWEKRLAQKRREQLASQFRDLLYGLSASVSAGRQLPQAFEEAGDQLMISYGKESPLCIEVERMVRSMRESRQSLEELLEDFARRSHVTEVRQFVHICRICRGTGGDLERVIGKTAAVLMEKIAVRREIQMLTAQKRLEAKILTAIPVAMVLMLNVLSPDYLAVLYQGAAGRLIMTGSLAGIALSYFISQRITEIEV